MIRTTIINATGCLALVVLSACATPGPPEEQANRAEQCVFPDTLTCDRFAGEVYNCSCERGTKLQDIVDVY